MTDTLTKERRSWTMSRIRSKDTKPELLVRKYLFSRGLRFRVNVSRLPGHPDIVLPKYRALIEVRGCFWHRHEGCATATSPKSIFTICETIRNPTMMSAGAVANAGIAVNTGAKKIARRNSAAVTYELSPVRPPTETPVADST